MIDTAGTLTSLSAAEIDGVATLWKRGAREFVTSFDGTSMLPAIAPGQEVKVACGIEPLVGDVAVFRYNDHIGVHRVVARSPAWLLTWGDNNPLPDEPVPPARVIGVIRDVPAVPRSLFRFLLLRFVAPSQGGSELLTRRVQIVYRVRSVWNQGFLAFAGTLLRALLRRILPS